MVALTTMRAADLLHGSLWSVAEGEGWVRPMRLAEPQLRALGSVRAWHPGLFKQMAACTAGVRLEFETDASRVSVEVALDRIPRGTAKVLDDVARHCGLAPDSGLLSVEVDGLPPVPVRPNERDVLEIDLAGIEGRKEQRTALPGMGRRRRVRVWLPCLRGCAVRDVSGDGGYLAAVAERRPLLVLGDSIAQGFVADQPACAWPAILARRTGLGLVNQGVGGQVFQPGTLWGAERLDPAAIVVEFGENYRYEPCSASVVRREARAYLDEVARAWPETPTWVLSVPPHSEETYPTHARSCFAEVDAIIAEAAGRHASMRLVDFSTLFDEGRLDVLLADGSDHPGREGQEAIAERLLRVMGLPAAEELEAAAPEPGPESVPDEAPAPEPPRPEAAHAQGPGEDGRAASAGSVPVKPTQLTIFDLLDEPAGPEHLEGDPAPAAAEPEAESRPAAEPDPAPAAAEPAAEPNPAPAVERSRTAAKGLPKKGEQRKRRASSKNHKSRRSRR